EARKRRSEERAECDDPGGRMQDGLLVVQSSLVESCLLRPWPGNARELIGEIRRAALAARDAGVAELAVDDIEPTAGLRIEGRAPRSPAEPAEPPARHIPAPLPDRDTIARSLAAEGGNVARTARLLGLHRTQLRRFLARHPDLAHAAETAPAAPSPLAP